MSWIEIDRSKKRPSCTTEHLWQSVDIRPVPVTLPLVDEYLAELRRMYLNGDAVFVRFEVNGNSDFDWFAARNVWDQIEFCTRFLTETTFSNALPEVAQHLCFDEPVKFERGSSLTLDGELAQALVIGGAYKGFEGSPRAAKCLAARVCDSIFGDRFLEIEVFRCETAWSSWFSGVCDRTFLIIDRRFQTVSVFASTDVD